MGLSGFEKKESNLVEFLVEKTWGIEDGYLT